MLVLMELSENGIIAHLVFLNTNLSGRHSGRHQRTGLGVESRAIDSISCITIPAITALTGDPMAHPEI